uniref:Uncharacterized protein n=1 Tax=Anguilla anguilla TaxID=7936 RepID=A0A0E9W2I6_ANGAN
MYIYIFFVSQRFFFFFQCSVSSSVNPFRCMTTNIWLECS